jgi:hypothetical protein
MTRDERTEELRYCADVVQSKGDVNVPRGSVRSYLEVQESGARHEGDNAAALAFACARQAIDDGKPWAEVAEYLRREADARDGGVL